MTAPHNHKIVKSDLVYSPAQVTEHQQVEPKDHNASEETKQHLEELKAKYPEVFSLNNEGIGHTQLITLDIDTGDSPPVCQKLYTLPLKHYSWVQQEIDTRVGWSHQEEHQSLGQPYCCCTQEICTW